LVEAPGKTSTELPGAVSVSAPAPADPHVSPQIAPVDKTAPQAETKGVAPAADASPAAPAESDTRSQSSIGSLSWQLPRQVKAGEQFTAVLRIRTDMSVRGLPMLIGFDPQVLQVVNVNEGDFLRRGGGQTDFNKRVDPAQGKIFLAAVRQNANGTDTGISGTGSVVAVTFKAVKPAEAARVLLQSIAPDPQPGTPVMLPVVGSLRVMP
jgi:general secretion pathway protein D